MMDLNSFVDSLNDEQLATLLLTMGNRKAMNRLSDMVYKSHYERQASNSQDKAIDEEYIAWARESRRLKLEEMGNQSDQGLS